MSEEHVARRVGALLLALAGGLIVFLGVATGGVALIVHLHHRQVSAFEHRQDAVVNRYLNEYRGCLQAAPGDRARCTELAYDHCAADPFWTKQYNGLGQLSAISDNCQRTAD